MSAIEELQAAIVKLTGLRDESFPGTWQVLTSGVEEGDHWYVCSDHEAILSVRANDGGDEAFREPTAKLIVTLHRTVDAQLAILRHTAAFYSGDLGIGINRHVVELARSINGGIQ